MWKPGVFLLAVLACSSAMASAALQTYWQDDACTDIDLGEGARLSWCVDRVVVLATGHLELETSWTVTGLSRGTLDKDSDANNVKMYLVDSLGNRYDHIETRGAAAEGGVLSIGEPVLRGVFVFPRVRKDATQFTFHDDDNHIAIAGISVSDSLRSDRATRAAVLGRVMQTERIDIDYSWTGLHGQLQEQYSLEATEGGFLARGVRDGGRPITLPRALIPAADVESFLATLALAPVLEGEYVPTMTRPDDYPSITIELLADRERIVFFTQSQGTDHVPWGVDSGGEVFVVPDATPSRALKMLDPFFGRDLASRAVKFLEPHVGDERAREVWSELEEELGSEDAYKTAFQLSDLLGGEDDAEVWEALDRYLEDRRAPPSPPESVPGDVLPDGDSAIVRAGREGDVAKLELFLGRGVDPDERSDLDGRTALIAASIGNHAGAVRILLSNGADASVRSRAGETALTLAASGNHLGSVQALLEAERDVDINIKGRDGKTPLMQAAQNGHGEIVAALLAAGADVDARSLRGGTALAFAAANHHLAVVRLLLGANANPNNQDSSGDTPLMTTLHPGIAHALIRAGANVDAKDDQGLTPMMRLSAGGGRRFGDTSRRGGGTDRVGTLEALLKARADVDARDSQGRTALIWATTGASGRESHPELLPLLINAGADVDAVDSKGGTALVYAAIHGHLESARILIEAGADVNVRMGRSTPLNFALDYEHADLVRLLLRSGARR